MNAKQFVEKVARLKAGKNAVLAELILSAQGILNESTATKGMNAEGKKQLQDMKKALAGIAACERIEADTRGSTDIWFVSEALREACRQHRARLLEATTDPVKLKRIFRRKECATAPVLVIAKPAQAEQPTFEIATAA
jgi:hypothetical protein